MRKLCIHRYLQSVRSALYKILLARAGRILSTDAVESLYRPGKMGR